MELKVDASAHIPKWMEKRAEQESIRNLIFARRLLDFPAEFYDDDMDRSYVRAVEHLVKMAYTATDRMTVRGMIDLRPDIKSRVSRGRLYWTVCVTAGVGDEERVKVKAIRMKGSKALVVTEGTEVLFQFGTDIEKAYNRFLKNNPDPPGEGVRWKFGPDACEVYYCMPMPLPVDVAWQELKRREEDDLRR